MRLLDAEIEKLFYCSTFFKTRQVRVLTHQGKLSKESVRISRRILLDSDFDFDEYKRAFIALFKLSSLPVIRSGSHDQLHCFIDCPFDSYLLSAMSQLLPKNCNAASEADQSTLKNNTTYTSNVTMAPTHTLSGSDTVTLHHESSLMETQGVAGTSEVATPNYSTGTGTGKRPSGKFKFSSHFSFVWTLLVYYRIYAEDGAIPSKTPTTGYPFVGHIKARAVPPPHTVKAVKRRIAKVEDIKDPSSISLFITPCSQSPMHDADKVDILKGTGPGSTPQEPLALVAKMSDSDRIALESGERVDLRVLSLSVIRRHQRSDIVCPINTLLLFFF